MNVLKIMQMCMLQSFKFLDSFKIQDWSAKFPNDLFSRTIEIYRLYYTN